MENIVYVVCKLFPERFVESSAPIRNASGSPGISLGKKKLTTKTATSATREKIILLVSFFFIFRCFARVSSYFKTRFNFLIILISLSSLAEHARSDFGV